MTGTAFVFPGQGSQAVGMGKDFYEASKTARRIYDAFDQVVPGLKTICFDGPEDQLKRTLYTQPAILATSLAALELFREQSDLQPVVTAGHSLGEYGALYASGVFDLETAARLVQKRAELMEHAPAGAMSAVLGLEESKVEAVLAQVTGVAVVANYNTDGQLVISGEPQALEAAAPLLKEAGAKRVLPLPVGGAFHSPIMDAAAQEFRTFLTGFSFANAQVPVLTNVDATPTSDGEVISAKLAEQINHSVRWTQTMSRMVSQEQVNLVIELGPGKVLTGMFKKMHPEVMVLNVYDLASLENVLTEMRQAVSV